MKKNLKGFTLVEVLIVIIIVGILIAALLPRLVGSQSRARDNARAAMVNQIANGLSLLLNDVGSMTPTGIVCATGATLTGAYNGGTVDLLDYLATIPKDPQSSHVNDALGSACTGQAMIYNGGTFAYVFAAFEQANGANITGTTASTATGLTDFQGLIAAGGTEGFGVLIR